MSIAAAILERKAFRISLDFDEAEEPTFGRLPVGRA